jgi:hypothetical protein
VREREFQMEIDEKSNSLDRLDGKGRFKPFPMGSVVDIPSSDDFWSVVLQDVEITICPSLDEEPENCAVEVIAWYFDELVAVPLIEMVKRSLGRCEKKNEIAALMELSSSINELIAEIKTSDD